MTPMTILSGFIDPGFYYEAALSKMAGHTALRMLNADLLPFDYRSLYKEIKSYTAELQVLTLQSAGIDLHQNEIIRKKYWVIAADTSRLLSPAAAKTGSALLDFSSLENAVTALGKATDHAYDIMLNGETECRNLTDSLNRKLYRAEQELLLDQGLPLRPWYKHVLYAPGYYTGYSVKTLPGIRESIEQRDFHQAEMEIRRAAASVNRLAEYLSVL